MNNWQGNNDSGDSWNRLHSSSQRPLPSWYGPRQIGRQNPSSYQGSRDHRGNGAAMPRVHHSQHPQQPPRPATSRRSTPRHFTAAQPQAGRHSNPPYPETDLGYSESDWGQHGEESYYGSDHIEPPPQPRVPLQTPQPRSRGPSRRQSYTKPLKYSPVQTLLLPSDPEHIYFDCELHSSTPGSERPVPNVPRLLPESRAKYCLGSPANRKAVLEHVGKQMLAVIRIYRQAGFDLQSEDRLKMDFVSAGRGFCGTSKKSCRDKACRRYVLTPNSLLVYYHEVAHMPRL